MQKISNLSQIQIILLFCLVFFSYSCKSNEGAKTITDLSQIEDWKPAIGIEENGSQSKCPRDKNALHPLPGVSKDSLSLEYWLNLSAKTFDLDEIILSKEQIDAQNHAQYDPLLDLSHRLRRDELAFMIEKRINSIAKKFAQKQLLFADKTSTTTHFWEETAENIKRIEVKPRYNVLLQETMIHCGPHLEAYILPDGEPRFSRNNCSIARAQELVEVFFEYPAGLLFVRTSFSWGWIDAKTLLSAPLEGSELEFWLNHANRYFTREEIQLNGKTYPKGSFFTGDAHEIHLAEELAFTKLSKVSGLIDTHRPLTRKTFLETLFSFLFDEYGWGGHLGRRDCSRLLLDVMKSFGLRIPRHSADQALASSFTIDTSKMTDSDQKLRILDEAHKQGIVFLHFPGHVMAYLGRDEDREPIIFHAFSEYLEECELDSNYDILVHVDTTTLSTLHLGKDTARRSFLERLSLISVYAPETGTALQDIAKYPEAKPPIINNTCLGLESVNLWTGAENPKLGENIRVIATSLGEERIKSSQLLAISPSNREIKLDHKLVLGPPHFVFSHLIPDELGTWRILLGNSQACYAEKRLEVTKSSHLQETATTGAWEVKNTWNEAYELLYSAFIYALFDYPVDEDLSWTNLHSLIKSKEKNILFNHLGQNEDENLRLVPDCADLPYLLRAYFAWKLKLPIGFRKCSRGKENKAPKCGSLKTQDDAKLAQNTTKSFLNLANGQIINAVHSASARTLPNDDESDLYPIALEKEWLRPGITFADPYGHLLVIAAYTPQTLDTAGVLLAVDAQPDGTITRKRFWKGNFLFSPDTSQVGAGFKAFRPVVKRGSSYVQLTNQAIDADSGFIPFSLEQYENPSEYFYDRMDQIINPRTLSPERSMENLVEALLESVQKRIVSVQNGEDYITKNGSSQMKMPSGHAVFETTGPWEDFATPSRDMRLLIALDTIEDFPNSIVRNAQKYDIPDSEAEAFSKNMEKILIQKLKSTQFQYTKSDKSPQTLSLFDIFLRREALEIAYHPADCVEYRWGAPEGSEEYQSCKRRASKAETMRIEAFRHWMKQRRRPPR